MTAWAAHAPHPDTLGYERAIRDLARSLTAAGRDERPVHRLLIEWLTGLTELVTGDRGDAQLRTAMVWDGGRGAVDAFTRELVAEFCAFHPATTEADLADAFRTEAVEEWLRVTQRLGVFADRDRLFH